MPRGQGIWPAFWMLGNDIGTNPWPNSGEIDIMENIGREPNTVYGTVHGPGYSGGERHRRRPHHRRAAGRRLPHVRHRMVAQPDHLVPGRLGVLPDHPGQPGRRPLGLRPPVLHDPERGGRRLLAGQPGRQHAVPADHAGRLRPRVGLDRRRHQPRRRRPAATRCGRTSAAAASTSPAPTRSTARRLQTWDCNGTAAQQWTFNGDGTLRAMGKCMDPAGGAAANGTPIQLVTCNGNPVQRFTLSAAGDLRERLVQPLRGRRRTGTAPTAPSSSSGTAPAHRTRSGTEADPSGITRGNVARTSRQWWVSVPAAAGTSMCSRT